MHTTEPLTLITALGPNALYVLAILVVIGQPVEQKRVQALAKFSSNTTAAAVAILIEHRLAIRLGRYLLQATLAARQLVLGEVLSTGTVESEPQKLRLGTSIIEAPGDLVVSSGSGSADPNESTAPPPLGQSGTSKIEAPHPQPIHNPAVLDALDAAGIGEPARSELAALPHVTPAYIAGHVVAAAQQGKDIGLAIWRMRQGWKPPHHRDGCQCQACRERYKD